MTDYISHYEKLDIHQKIDSTDYVLDLDAKNPTYLISSKKIEKDARNFIDVFPGKVMYSVKTNPAPEVLKAIIQAGINCFDVSSLNEIKLIKSINHDAMLYFMNPVKKEEDIHSAYFHYNVRHFSLDHIDEFYKILRATNNAKDLCLTIRIDTGKNQNSFIDFSKKFGASKYEAGNLLIKTRPIAKELNLSFHVGTQTIEASRYKHALETCQEIVNNSGIKIDGINVGGGFPVGYESHHGVRGIEDYIFEIKNGLANQALSSLDLISEPGRILVAQGVKLITRVELRKDDLLFINDGIYGGLFDASDWLGLRYPVQAVSKKHKLSSSLKKFQLAGVTCDSLDMISNPLELPKNIGMGDWIIFENIGAYSQCMRSDFNGFGDADTICI